MAAEETLSRILAGPPQPIYLVRGDRVLAEPAAQRLATALAERGGGQVELHRRPEGLSALLADLRTFSLFGGAKVLVVVESAVLADQRAAAALLHEALEVLPFTPAGGESVLSPRERSAALRLLQALRLFGIDPLAGSEAGAISALPDEAWKAPKGGSKGRGRAKASRDEGDPREGLAALLAAARREGLEGRGESDVADLALALQQGLPDGHHLVLVESAAPEENPLVRSLVARGSLIDVGTVQAERGGGWSGVDRLATTLREETGAAIAPDALAELARRTLRAAGRGAPAGGSDADSTARFAGEYRKLAALTGGERIGRAFVEQTVVDRGEEDVWQLLEAIGAGRAAEALSRLDRLLAGAEEPEAARLSFFALLAGLARQLTALAGLARRRGVPPADRDYNRFKTRWAPLLQAPDPELPGNPLAGLHPFRLHRAYLLAARLPEPLLARLPWHVLETERRLKGDSAEPASALAELVLRLTPR